MVKRNNISNNNPNFKSSLDYLAISWLSMYFMLFFHMISCFTTSPLFNFDHCGSPYGKPKCSCVTKQNTIIEFKR